MPIASKIILQWGGQRSTHWNFVKGYTEHPSGYNNIRFSVAGQVAHSYRAVLRGPRLGASYFGIKSHPERLENPLKLFEWNLVLKTTKC